MSRRKQTHPKSCKHPLSIQVKTELSTPNTAIHAESENSPLCASGDSPRSPGPDRNSVDSAAMPGNGSSYSSSGGKSGDAQTTPHNPRSPEVYLCPVCNRGFETSEELNCHDCHLTRVSRSPACGSESCTPRSLLSAAEPQAIKCAMCGISVDDIGALQMHTLQAHSVQDLRMNSDTGHRARNGRMSSPRSSSRSKNDDKPYGCEQCDRSFDSILALHNHGRNGTCKAKREVEAQNHEKHHVCEICSLELPSASSLEEHRDEHRQRHSCPECEQTFVDPQALETHAINEHYLERTVHYICGACGKNFDAPDDLQRHLLDLHAVQIYRCSLCKQLFESRVDIQVHFAVTHSQHAESFPCRGCKDGNFVFESEDGLRLHVDMFHLGGARAAFGAALGARDLSSAHVTSRVPDLIRWCDPSFQQKDGASRAFACKLCPESFDVEFLYERHMESIHAAQLFGTESFSTAVDWPSGPSPKRARDEKYGSYSVASLASEPTVSKCSICDKICDSAQSLAEHRLVHCRVAQSDTCAICRKVLSSLEDFFVHSHEHNGQGNVQICVICKQSLSTPVELHFHGKFHLNRPDAPKSSSPADLSLNRAETRAVSRGTPELDSIKLNPARSNCSPAGSLPYQCIKCQSSFATEPEIRAHVTTHMLKEGVAHRCHLCPEVFDSPSKLQCHLIDHTFSGHSEYECYICGSMFTLSSSLQQHMFLHPYDERQYACCEDGCSQKYFFRTELDNHTLVDHGTKKEHQKVFKCGSCEKHFPSLELVAVHRRFCSPPPSDSHSLGLNSSSMPAHPCNLCKKVFSSLSALQGHSHVHMPNKGMAHKCPTCSKIFQTNSKLRNHLRCHNREPGQKSVSPRNGTFPCEVCGRSFTRRDNLKAHMKTHGRTATPDGMFNGLPTLVPPRPLTLTRSPDIESEGDQNSLDCDNRS